ncbi:tyrosine-type recombinase/integrase [Noviherbaspirillum agri]
MNQPTDLFDVRSTWVTRPLVAFGGFIRSKKFVELGKHGAYRRSVGQDVRPLSKESAAIYTLMFKTYLRWIQNRGLRLHEVDHRDIQAFLEGAHVDENNRARKINSAIRTRYLRLLERVYTHIGIEPNPAAVAARGPHGDSSNGRDEPTAYLTEAQQLRFLANLPAAEPMDPDIPNAPSWKKRRDRAMLALMLGSGLKLSQVLNLRVDQVKRKQRDGSLPIHIPDYVSKGAGHNTVVRPFAAKYVHPWIEERKEHNIPSKLLFPASLVADKPLHKATVYRHVKATLEKAGIDVSRKGGRTLRNSFAVREINEGSPLELVKEYMGHYELRSTEKYIVTDQRQGKVRKTR